MGRGRADRTKVLSGENGLAADESGRYHRSDEKSRATPIETFFPITVAATPPRARLGRRVAKTGSNVIAFFPDFIVRIRCVFAATAVKITRSFAILFCEN